ncbi:DUF4232 domain-containing protein [Kitasatospora kifunensis]|uniref:DUF4232 domain-containing protein n=1 Tax=Kitasatospora kifunensis TaxID=58351 RepID=A0A7W7R948_KITKI|nr:DUF4232 domain-containing protein [Kitasatospora kifunensis]MBB4927737.1 hypothetical protein [Kitasatospora kifunensis]
MRPAIPFALSAVVASTLLLAGCGSQNVASGSPATSGSPTCTPSTPVGDAGALKRDNVTIVSPGCRTSSASAAEFEVTNAESEPFTYTVTLNLLNDAGEVMDSIPQTVASVAPGQTVRHTVNAGDTGRTGTSAVGARVRIAKVRAVPSAEAPVAAGTCPPSGIRVTADEVDAAMGLRAVGLHLTNCGTGAYSVNGYPQFQFLDQDRKPVTGIRTSHGTDAIATGIVPDAPPKPVTLQPGESASATLAWRNTTGAGDPVDIPYVRVSAKPGAPTVIVTPELDLGTTGAVGVSAWQKP